MNHTGVRSTGSRRQACTSRGSDTAASLAFGRSVPARQLPAAAEPDRPAAALVVAEDAELERRVGEGELLRAVAALHRHGDYEPSLAHRQPGEVQAQPLELRRAEQHSVDRLPAELVACRVADADRHAPFVESL